MTAQQEDPLNRVPQEYHDFCNMFSGEKANVLAPHQPYDLKINLEEGTKPFHGPIYSLLPPELTAVDGKTEGSREGLHYTTLREQSM